MAYGMKFEDCTASQLEDVYYYVDEAFNDINTKGNTASIGKTVFAKISGQYYRLDRAVISVDEHGYKEYDKHYNFVPIAEEDVKPTLARYIFDEDGYKSQCYSYDCPLFHDDAVKIMEMGGVVKHERYNAYFKMEDGVIMDYWPDYDGDGGEDYSTWIEFDIKAYGNGEATLNNTEYMGWTMAENYLQEEKEIREARAEFKKEGN